MYWRVRKITPEILLRQYAVHILLALSLFFNFILFVSRPKKETVSKELQTNFVDFAKQVTTHLLDTSYITYMDSTVQLQSELAPKVLTYLRAKKLLAANNDELKVTNLELQRTRQVCTVRFDSVTLNDPNQSGLVPVDVQGVIAIHSSDETGPTTPQPFHFVYLVGISGKTKKPIVADFQEKPVNPG